MRSKRYLRSYRNGVLVVRRVEPSVTVLMIGTEVTTEEYWSFIKYWMTFE